MKPLHKHDSDCCVFVKVGKDDFGEIFDIYVCRDVVIYRYSDEPSDNRAISMRLVRGYPEHYKRITGDVDIMNVYHKFEREMSK